jgi:hypothetical protein
VAVITASVAKKSKIRIEQIIELANRLPVKDRLRIISNLADELSAGSPPKKPRKPITQ